MPPARRTTPWARVLVLLLFALSLGCKSASGNYATYSEAPTDDGSSYGYGGAPGYGTSGDGGDYGYDEAPAADYDYEYDTVATERPAEPRRWASKQKAEKERGGDKFKSAPEPEEAVLEETKPTDAPEAEPLAVGKDPQNPSPAPVAEKRQVIYTATMQVSVFDLEHSLEVVESLPERYGGWMQQRVDNQIVLRIPAERLAEAMATVAELGVVDYRLLEALDVTAEYTDLESRIRILAEMQKQLQALLARATTVEQALEIRRALDAVTLELEAARAQMRELSKSIAFSTLILSLVERGPTQLVPSSNDPFTWVDQLGVEVTDYR